MSRIAVLLLCAFQLLSNVRQCDSGLIRRIVNGVPHATPNFWPFLVSLHFRGTVDLHGLHHLCAGTLIHRQWVLTAGHCFDQFAQGQNDASNWTAVLGEYHRQQDEATEQRIEIEKIIQHPNFRILPRFTADIALLKLRHPAVLNSAVNTAVIDRRNWIRGDCQVSGWGQQAEAYPGDPGFRNGTMVPHIINVNRASVRRCVSNYSSIPFIQIDRTVVCFEGRNADTCHGDSGGPMMCTNPRNGRYVVSGLVSMGLDCNTGVPGIYTNVGQYRRWIVQTLRANPGEGSSNLPRPSNRNRRPS